MKYVRLVPTSPVQDRVVKALGALWPDYCYPCSMGGVHGAVMIAEPIKKCLGMRSGLLLSCIVHVCIATWQASDGAVDINDRPELVDGVKAALLAGDWRAAWELCWPHMADEDGPI